MEELLYGKILRGFLRQAARVRVDPKLGGQEPVYALVPPRPAFVLDPERLAAELFDAGRTNYFQAQRAAVGHSRLELSDTEYSRFLAYMTKAERHAFFAWAASHAPSIRQLRRDNERLIDLCEARVRQFMNGGYKADAFTATEQGILRAHARRAMSAESQPDPDSDDWEF
jgi:hypothetical protein